MPTCLHVGLQNRRFFKILGFQDGLKFSSISGSIFYRFWVRLGLQLGAILGPKTAQNSKKWVQKKVPVLPKSRSEYDVASELRSRPFCHRFWGCQGSIFEDFEIVLGLSGLDFGVVRARFGGCQGSIFQNGSKSKKNTLSMCTINPRACRGQNRKRIPCKLPQESLDHKVKVSFRPQPRNTKMT